MAAGLRADDRAARMSQNAKTVPQWWREIVTQRGNHPALVMRSAQFSYSELDQQVAQMARALVAEGAGKGSRIALLAPDGVLWITSFLACLRIGALVTVVSTLCTPSELAHMLRHSDIQLLISARRFLRHDYAQTLQAALPGLAACATGPIRVPTAPYLRRIWLDDADGVAWAQPIDALLSQRQGPGDPGQALLEVIEQQVVPDDDAVIVYTSGSTSQPKAVVHSQHTLATHPVAVAKLFLLHPNDRMMPLLPAFWLGGMVMALEVFSTGATLVYPDSPDHADVLDAIEMLQVNRLNSWGDMLVKLRAAAIDRGINVDAIVGLGPFRDARGELIPPSLQSNMLGMSESFAVHSAEPLNVRLPEDKAGASGRAVNGYQRRVVDPESGAEVGVGEIGELQLRGGGLMSGFYKVPRQEVFTRDGFYATGDLVRIDEDGYLFFVARRGDMIKTRAANVSRLEVEAALRQLPDVAQAVVTGIDDPELGQRVVAAVIPQPGCQPSEGDLQQALRQTLSSYKVPRTIVFIDETAIPRTSTGKIRLSELATMISSRIEQQQAG